MSNILGEGNASVFVDGILYSDSILSFPFDIVDRVEVIKGPQAALFGRATFSGAINLITKKGSNEPEHTVSARLAEYGDTEVNLLSRGAIREDRLRLLKATLEVDRAEAERVFGLMLHSVAPAESAAAEEVPKCDG